jgi:hypothetical protein
MVVGVVTFSAEVKYFGKKFAILRNTAAFVFSFLIAWVIGRVCG